VPVWRENPYHLELERSLRTLGLHVLAEHSLKSLYAAHVRGVEKVDVLHLHALPYLRFTPVKVGRYLLFYWRLKRMREFGVPVIWTVHDFQNHDSPHWRLEDFVSRQASHRFDNLIVHGETAKQMVESQWACPSQRITVIPHGNYINSYRNNISRSAARASLALEDASTVFLFLGLIRPYKGVVEMVQAFKTWAEPGSRLIIAGKPAGETIKEEVTQVIGGDDRIRFIPGFVKDDDVQVYMKASDVVVLPYKRILTSGAAILAMSFGKPCIAPRAGCITDTLGEQGTFFFQPTVTGDLDRALREAFRNRRNLASMGDHNYRRALECDWSRVGTATAAVYRKCLNRETTASARAMASLT
jgi:beta-1,4-mannosyltransferase